MTTPRKSPPNAYLTDTKKVAVPVHRKVIASFLDKDLKAFAGLSISCIRLNSIYKPVLIKQLQQKFLQAVVDDDIETVKSILDANPALLFDTPKEDLMIQSQYTWVKLNLKNENALTIAAKRRQIEMLELLMSYVDKLQDQALIEETKADVLSKWPSFEHKEKKGEWDIPAAYIIELKKIVAAFKNEPSLNDSGVKAKYSEKTKLALQQFLDYILPDKAVTLDELIQPELFLYAAYKVYYDHSDHFKNWNQNEAYCGYGFGLPQSLCNRKDGEKWCRGLYYVVEEKQEIGDRARELKLVGGENFYRSSRDSFSGLGGKYFCNALGSLVNTLAMIFRWHSSVGMLIRLLQKQSQAKTRTLQNLCKAKKIGHTLKRPRVR